MIAVIHREINGVCSILLGMDKSVNDIIYRQQPSDGLGVHAPFQPSDGFCL